MKFFLKLLINTCVLFFVAIGLQDLGVENGVLSFLLSCLAYGFIRSIVF